MKKKKEKVEKRQFKVAKFRILKPAGDMKWKDLAKIFRDTRYRVFRLANMAISEEYLKLYLNRTGKDYEVQSIYYLSKQLRDIMISEILKKDPEKDREDLICEMNRYSKNGVLPSVVVEALHQNKIRAVMTGDKLRDILTGKSSLPTFRLGMPIPIRCDKNVHRKIIKEEDGNHTVELMIGMRPYPKVILKTSKLDGSSKKIIEELVSNKENSLDGYRQRFFEIKQDKRDSKVWNLLVSYDFPEKKKEKLNDKITVGIDVGYSTPLHAALNEGRERLGDREFAALGNRIKRLRNRVMSRRRSILRSGRNFISENTSRSGHGIKRKLKPINILSGKIEDALTTLNHQLSSVCISFALKNNAATIQMENLEGLKDVLTGTYLGQNWRYYQLFQFIEYKAKENGIKFKKIDPYYTSRRCHECGFINKEFDRKYRDKNRKDGRPAGFVCPECGLGKNKYCNPDFNAAKNIAVNNIGKIIEKQCKKQGIVREKSSLKSKNETIKVSSTQIVEGTPVVPKG
jgi:IS605 OrfB family transposase